MPRHGWIAGLVAVVVLVFSSAFFSWVSVQLRLPLLQELMLQTQVRAYRESQAVIHNNLQLMATRLGELQAQLAQLNGQSERLEGLLNPGKAAKKSAGMGGPFLPFEPTPTNLKFEIDRLSEEVEARSESLAMLESSIVERRVLQRFLPTGAPITEYALGSPFGFRVDPFSGHRALHQGMDLNAPVGTPVMAAAAGVVTSAGWHPEYGQLLVVDHGMDIETRYAHLSRMDVKAGQLVRQGQVIGALGNTGRSTGPHLHFEVRAQGVYLNPANFIQQQLKVAQRLPEVGRR